MSHLNDPVCFEFLRGESASPDDSENATGGEALWGAILGYYFRRQDGWFVWSADSRDTNCPGGRSVIAMNITGAKRSDALVVDIKCERAQTSDFVQSLNSTARLEEDDDLEDTPRRACPGGGPQKSFKSGIVYKAMAIGTRIRFYKWDVDENGRAVAGSRRDLYVEEGDKSYSREYGGRFFDAYKDANVVEVLLSRIRDCGLNTENWREHYYPYAFLLSSESSM